jgi:hypothetical protein
MDPSNKDTVSHIDAIESANNSDHDVPLKHYNSANEEIVAHIQNSGDEVGMTWRSIMAAVVSIQ